MAGSLNNIKLYYFPIAPLGRGEIIRLFLQEHAVKHDFVEVQGADWRELKAKLQAEKTFDRLPMLVTEDGKRYFGTIPIIRFLSKELGLTRKDKDEEQFVETTTDYASDWQEKIFATLFGPKPDFIVQQYATKDGRTNFERFERIYSSRVGPYLLGNEMTYADLFVYHCINEDGITEEKLKEYPNLAKLRVAVQDRPNIKSYLASREKSN